MAQYRAMIRGIDMCATQYPLIRFEKIINGGKNRHTTNKYVAIHGQTYNKEQHTFRVYIDQVGSPPEEKKIRYLIKSIAAQQRRNINKSKERQSSKIYGSAVQTSKHVPDEVALDTEKEQTDDEDEAPIVVAAKKRKILPALPMQQLGDHLEEDDEDDEEDDKEENRLVDDSDDDAEKEEVDATSGKRKLSDRFKELNQLYDIGYLSERDYNKQKKKLMKFI